MAELRLSTEPHGASVVVSVQGELDVTTSHRFDDCLSEAVASSDRVILDLSAVEFMDTTALAVIVGHWRRLVAADGVFVLAGARYRSTRALWITGLADRLPMYETVGEALAAAQAGQSAPPEPAGPEPGAAAESGRGAGKSGGQETTGD